jgi:hypothetical protein
LVPVEQVEQPVVILEKQVAIQSLPHSRQQVEDLEREAQPALLLQVEQVDPAAAECTAEPAVPGPQVMPAVPVSHHPGSAVAEAVLARQAVLRLQLLPAQEEVAPHHR